MTSKTARVAIFAFLVAVAATALAACGGGGSSTSSSGSSSTGGSEASSSESFPKYSDWPYFGRDRDNTRFATQDEIDTGNVGELGEAWSTGVGPDQFLMEAFPTVIGSTVYVTTSTDEVLAIDGATGKTLWTYTPEVDFSQSTGVGGYGISVNRGIAHEGGKLFVLTFDDKLQAISAKTGEKLWSSQVADPSTGAYQSMAPTAYDGKVFVGVSGSEDGVRGFLAAYDQKTGKKIWQFYTVPKEGTGWVPKGGGGGTIYMPPTIDTRTGTIYAGTGNPAPVIVGAKRPGRNLYTDSILALNADTGKLKWFHQEQAHDLWDYDAESPVLLFDVEINGETKRGLAEAGKNGLLFLLDAETGKDLFPPVPFVKRAHTPPTTKGTLECPGPVGGSQYSPLAYSPETEAVYVSGINLCMVLRVTFEQVGGEKQFGGDRHLHRGHRQQRQGAVEAQHADPDGRRRDGERRRPRLHRRPAGHPLRLRRRQRRSPLAGQPQAGLRRGTGDLRTRRHRVRAGDGRRRRPQRLRRTRPGRRPRDRPEARRQEARNRARPGRNLADQSPLAQRATSSAPRATSKSRSSAGTSVGART
jgi:PQQ-dependent dehydrogenase (methanol/ethanol family)